MIGRVGVSIGRRGGYRSGEEEKKMRESRGGAFESGVATAKLNPLTYYYSAPNLRVRFCNISDKGGTPSQMCFPILTHTRAWEGFEHEPFPLKFNATVFKYKIHSVEVDLYYLK